MTTATKIRNQEIFSFVNLREKLGAFLKNLISQSKARLKTSGQWGSFAQVENISWEFSNFRHRNFEFEIERTSNRDINLCK